MLITKLGKEKLEQHIIDLKEELRLTYLKRSEAAAEGDLKENSAYIFAGDHANLLNSQIEESVTELKNSKIATPPNQCLTIDFGHKVSLVFQNDQRQISVTLVGKNDARLKPDWVSIDSPLGIAITGKHKNDQVLVNDSLVTIQSIEVGEI